MSGYLIDRDDWVHQASDCTLSDCRPVAVIDPEDREQVERLYDLYFVKAGEVGDRMQAALREFASPTPPKPDEPQGLGAVVEDAAGLLWVRVNQRVQAVWRPADTGSSRSFRGWSDIKATRVLSEGVTA